MKKDCLQYFFFSFFLLFSTVLSAQVIAGGFSHSLSVCSNNASWHFGSNTAGELGDGTTTSPRLTPIQPIVLSNITALATSKSHSLFVKSDGTAWACGGNSNGQIGDGAPAASRSTPVQVTGLTGIIAVSAGNAHSLFLRSDGTVWACGSNSAGQLGDGSTTQRNTPVQVSGLTGVTSIGAAVFHSLFRKSDGTAWACGRNDDGQLGDGSTVNSSTVVQVINLTGISSIAANSTQSLFLKNDNTAWGCGANDVGGLGDGTSGTDRHTPVQVIGLTGVTTIAAGSRGNSFFIKNDATVWACGYNANGQLGDGTTVPKATAVQVTGITGVTAVGAGGLHTLFAKSDGTVWACGANTAGAFGNGTTTDSYTVVQSNLFGTPGGCNVIPLPIELLSFTANPYQGNSVLCNWATASEINNDFFTLEKSTDAINFYPFANVDGAGNSSTTLYYQYIDADPYMGLSYYRLKQTDFNGQYAYSDIRSVYFGGLDIISIYPNPGSDYIFYTITSEKSGPVTLKLYDVLGREVLSNKETIESGVVTKKLNTSTLSTGSYLLQIATDQDERVQKQFLIKK